MNTAIYEDDRVCILSAYNPARAIVPACNTDVARTFAEHSTLDLMAEEYQREQIETAACEQQESTWRTA